MANPEFANLRDQISEFQAIPIIYVKGGKRSQQTISREEFLNSITQIMSYQVTDEIFDNKRWTVKTNLMFQQEMYCRITINFNPDIGDWGRNFIHVSISSNPAILKTT